MQAGIGKVVFISSGGTVYGRPASLPIKETHPADPICSYGITKLAIEKYLAMFERLRRVTGRSIECRYKEARSLNVPKNVLDISLARKELRWNPGVGFSDGLERTWNWFKANPGALIRALNLPGRLLLIPNPVTPFEPRGLDIYTVRIYSSEKSMKTAKVFKHGNSQAVRLPKEFRFNDNEVLIKRSGRGVLLLPRKIAYERVMAVVSQFKGKLERRQPKDQKRKWS